MTVEHLHIVHRDADGVQVVHAAGDDLQGLNIQGHVRSSAEAFLSKKVIICEGQTEVGFMRGMDHLWSKPPQTKEPFSYMGIVLLNAGGASKISGLATGFRRLHYDVIVLADGDAQDQFSDQNAADLRKIGASVTMWANNLSIEQCAMSDLPWMQVQASLTLAAEREFPVVAQVASKLQQALPPDFSTWEDSPALRAAIGAAAKGCSWFKDITHGELWGEIVFSALAIPAFQKTDLATKLQQLRDWIDND
ncbi:MULTISPECIES: TOPRIM nucleotidyl transferase/hydrolase domain-containing protein [unclassified Herbaspirillum]|uniref:TOPRIM nucleotidyl transferase/hydrolase domain-containing protein n=1 Tax=unclassified Herbaspirillum TaxID=2624150 RepID=UPI0018F71381|nr:MULTISPECIES: TOPRIM nucleotidyl transferase/hydrolase domain-containing protein [unclassified Herbaspirillum]